jgi:hypothetical protein
MLELSLEYDIILSKADNYFESAIATYITDINFAYMVTESSQDMDELTVLCIEAGGDFTKKLKKTFDTIALAIKNFISKIVEKSDISVQKKKIDIAISKARHKSIKSVKKGFETGKYTVDEAKFKMQNIQTYFKEYSRIAKNILELSVKIKKTSSEKDLETYRDNLNKYYEELKNIVKIDKIALTANINKDIECAEDDLIKITKLLKDISDNASKTITEIYLQAESADDDGDGVPNPTKVKLIKECASIISKCAKLSAQAITIVTKERINAINKALEELPDKIEDKKDEIRDKIEKAKDERADKKDAKEDEKYEREREAMKKKEARNKKINEGIGNVVVKAALH